MVRHATEIVNLSDHSLAPQLCIASLLQKRPGAVEVRPNATASDTMTPSECRHQFTDRNTHAYGGPLRADVDFGFGLLDVDHFFLPITRCFVHVFLSKKLKAQLN